MESKSYRLREFISPSDGRSLVIDTSPGLSLGALPGLEDYMGTAAPLLPLADGIVASPGMARRLSGRTRQHAALLVRADWTNALRGPDFVLPPESVGTVPLLEPADGLDLGASALVVTFLLGHKEAVEADCLRRTVQLSLAGTRVGVPLIVDVHPIGPRVVLRVKAIELGVSYALEGGADGIAIPWSGATSFATIQTMAAGLPVWIKPGADDFAGGGAAQEALDAGATGLWLGAELFAQPDPAALVTALGGRVHAAPTG